MALRARRNPSPFLCPERGELKNKYSVFLKYQKKGESL